MDVYKQTIYGAIGFGVFIILLSIVYFLLIKDIRSTKEEDPAQFNQVTKITPSKNPLSGFTNPLENNSQTDTKNTNNIRVIGNVTISGSVDPIDINTLIENRVAATEVLYEVELSGIWNKAQHKDWYPNGAHLSPMVAWSFANVNGIWEIGGTSTPGFEIMAETGETSTLVAEIETVRASNDSVYDVKTGRLRFVPNRDKIEVKLTPSKSRISVVSMIAPSPDWFIGVENLELYKNGNFIDSVTIPAVIYDAGTDEGLKFESRDEDVETKQPIGRINGQPDSPIAYFKFTKI